jgi:tetratricopeptide (TPR) repeat protein
LIGLEGTVVVEVQEREQRERSAVYRALRRALLLTLLALSLEAQPTLDSWTIEHFEQARKAQADGHLDQAARLYREVLDRNPKFAGAYVNLGIVYQLQSKYREAIKTLRSGLSVDPEMAGARVLLGISYYMVQDFPNAEAALRQVLASNPGERQAGVYRALALVGMDRPEEAARQLRSTAVYFPEDTEVTYQLGNAYSDGVRQSAALLQSNSRTSALYHWASAISSEQKNDGTAAIFEYVAALSLDPNIPQIYRRLAALFANDGCPQVAREALDRLEAASHAMEQPRCPGEKPYLDAWRKLGPVRPDASLPRIADSEVDRIAAEQMNSDRTGLLKAAIALFEKGDYAAAAKQIDSAVARGHWILGYLLARCYMAMEKYDDAEQILETVLARHLAMPSVAVLRLEIQSVLALRCYDAVVSQKPDSDRARILRAKALAAANKTDESIQQYREVIRSQPGMPQLHMAIAEIYSDQLNWAGVIQELNEELLLSRDNGLALALLGHAYAETDDADHAIHILVKVLADHPADARAMADLGKAYAKKGEVAKAIAAYEKAVKADDSQYRLHYRLYRLYQATGQPELAQKHLTFFQAEDVKHKAKTDRIATP